jgi:hypothetical protein
VQTVGRLATRLLSCKLLQQANLQQNQHKPCKENLRNEAELMNGRNVRRLILVIRRSPAQSRAPTPSHSTSWSDPRHLEAIVEIHAHSHLDLDIPVERFREEMSPIRDPARLRRRLPHRRGTALS